MLALIRIAAGWLLLIGGVIGLFLPFLQGVLMIVIGLSLLAPELPWARRLSNSLRQGRHRAWWTAFRERLRSLGGRR